MSAQPARRPISVHLISAPKHPIGTLLYVWLQSRHDKFVPLPEDLQELVDWFPNRYPIANKNMQRTADMLGFSVNTEGLSSAQDYLMKTALNLLTEGVPVTEFLTFAVEIENVSISLREQLVRHRVGVALDPRLGADLIPHVVESAEWVQGSRALDYSTFYDEGRWFRPDSLEGKLIPRGHPLPGDLREGGLEEADYAYRFCLQTIQNTYHALVSAGVPLEDCRQLLPLAVTHRLSWSFNYKSISHIVGRRSCFIAQLGLWYPVVTGISEELRKISPLLGRSLVDPPCFKAGQFAACPFDQINSERIKGVEGPMAPCSLWLSKNPDKASEASGSVPQPLWTNVNFPEFDQETADAHGENGEAKFFSGERVSTGNTADTKETLPESVSHKPFPGGWVTREPLAAQAMQEARRSFAKLWGRDVDTGEATE